MIKIFTLNKNNKIELTKKQLEDLLNEAYWEGQKSKNYWTYTSPNIVTTPYTLSSNDTTTGGMTITTNGVEK